MNELKELYKELERYQNFDEDNNCFRFLEIVDKIVLKKNPESINVLIKYFDDNSEYDLLLTSLRKALEYYPREIYISEMLENLEFLIKKSPLFTDEIFNSVFNEQEDQKFFRFHMHLAPRNSLLKLFEIMETESPHHRELIAELRQELDNQ